MNNLNKILPILIFISTIFGCSSDSSSKNIETNNTNSFEETDNSLGSKVDEQSLKSDSKKTLQEPKIPEVYLQMPKNNPCNEREFYRLKSKECLSLKYPHWGFKEFVVPSENNYTVTTMTQDHLQEILSNIPKEGGRVSIPEGTIELIDGITIPSNVILEGAGVGKTILSNRSSQSSDLPPSVIVLDGGNIVIRGLSIDGNGESLNGVDGHRSKSNILIEFIEAKNLDPDIGAGISFFRDRILRDSQITIRYNTLHNSLHGIAMKLRTYSYMLIYSNQAFNNRNYGLDISSTSYAFVAGNYFHNNEWAGAKTPKADRIFYYNNDVNYNKRAGLVYVERSRYSNAIISVVDNNLSQNGGKAFDCWNAALRTLILKNNIVTGSVDENNYSIGVTGARFINITGDHGKIWNERHGTITYYDQYGKKIVEE